MSRALRLVQRAQSMFTEADAEGRELGPEERATVQELLDQARDYAAAEKQIHEIGKALGAPSLSVRTDPNVQWSAADPGTRFIESQGYKSIQDASSRGATWSTGPVEITSTPHLQVKGTLGETSGWGGGAFVATPQVAAGVVQTLFQPLAVESVLGAAVATGATVRYITQSTAISGAAGVAEGAAKPESTLAFDYADEPVKKIATFLPLSEEMIEDAPSLQQFVNSQLITFVNIEAESQLLYGTAGGDDVQGLLVSRNVPIYTGSTATDGNLAAQLFKGMNSMRGSAFVEPEWALLSPADYETLRLLEDQNGQLYGGGPFFGPYGNSTPVAASGQITGATDNVWGKPVYVTSALGAGTALVGNRAGASVFNRGGVRVEASNSHSTFFQENLVAIRAERRLALAVFRPQSFVEVRFGT